MWTESPRLGIPRVPHHEIPASRREFLARAGCGFGGLALAHLLASEGRAAPQAAPEALAQAQTLGSPLLPRPPHHPARARSVIFLFLEGGPSHLDTFDPKPALNRLAGEPIPRSFNPPITAMGEVYSPLLASRRTWRRHGMSGLWVSDWLPHIARRADEIAVLRSCYQDGLNHVGSVCQMNTGSVLAGRPSLGAWATYGLGTESQSLPAFVVLLDRKATVAGGARNWGTGFMPATYQGTELRNEGDPIAHLRPASGASRTRQRAQLDLLDDLNRRHLEGRRSQSALEARIAAYELAYRMQAEAPEAVDLSRETAATRTLYGLDAKETEELGRVCLLARRLVERGVRFVQVYSGAGSRWDSHQHIEKGHAELCRSMDRPVAGLLEDLKLRGLLDEVLVVWGGEFGRTPMSEKGDGRDHNPTGFTMWFAGAGVRPGQAVGETDELGLHAVSDRAHVHDIHATILHLLGLHHRRLNYHHNGRLENVTINDGAVVEKLLA